MIKLRQLLRGLWLSLPIAAVSCLSILATAGTPTITPATGKISTQSMSDFEAYPSGVNNLAAPPVPPLIMLVMSKDEQLFNKAYPDYTDLNNDGVVDTTYQNAFDYNGYFDPALCYTYSSNVFAASATASNHQCSNSKWSGNFLNWVAMSRLDIIRWVLYGGTRSTDTASSTILERAEIPDDLHAWAKVYSGSDINKYTPFTATTTFCNVSDTATGSWTKPGTTTSGVGSTPQIRAANGDWSDWATTAKLQCQWKGNNAEGDSNRPSSSGGNTAYNARVKVCQNSSSLPNESFCVATGTSLKPEGLLQKYSTKDLSNQKRFGLITGSWTAPRKGGEVRRNIGQLNFNTPGSACAAGDEFSSADGTFCYKSAASSPSEGIVMTLDRLQIIGWSTSRGDYQVSGSTRCDAPGDGTAWGARGYDIQANASKCPDFGNPLAGMYAEALRYIQGATGPTYTDSGALPNPSWTDPYGTVSGKQRNQPCATCSIVLISSGLNSFDDANVPAVTWPGAASLTATSLTDTVQTKEGITGSYLLSTYYNNSSLTGAPANGTLTAAGTNFSDMALCTPATIGNLSALTGVCLGTPGQEGSYLIAGLSYGAWTSPIRTANVSSNFKVKTYGISLSDNLPSFSIPVGTKSISLSPTCRADPAGKGTFASCYVGSVSLGARQNQSANTLYGLTPTATYPNVGSYYLVWEDSQYGSDHDQDATNVITWCVGDSCNMPSKVVTGGVAICDPLVIGNKAQNGSVTQGGACKSNGKLNVTLGSTDVLVRNQWIGYSSGAMYIGYQLSGTTADAVTEVSNSGVSFGCNMLADIVCNSSPQVNRFTLGSGGAVTTLQTPLWYAAKYSGFTGTSPTLAAGTDPSNYFFARNAGELKDNLDSVFRSITSTAANNFGNATTPSSSNDVKGNGLSYQVGYFQQRLGVSWTGSLQAFWSDSEGYQREGKVVSGKQVLDSSSNYVVTGPDTSSGALSGAYAPYRCSVKPAPTGSTPFDPSTNTNCTIVSATNLLQPAWDAGTLLNAYYDPTAATGSADATAIANLATQRTYGADASATANIGQRYIFTYLTQIPNGSNATGTVANGTQTAFVWNDAACDGSGYYTLSSTSGFCGAIKESDSSRTGNYGLLNERDPTLAKELVNWVRGVEYPADYRSRTNNLTTGKSTYRLGDIVDSSPMIVDTPAESYDILYSDFSYSSFRANYRNRRQMVYVGANDGMLHAFNGGFYVTGQAAGADPVANPATNPTAYRQLPTGLKTGDATTTQGNNWALGQEAWAFVPGNLLPHLRWLADKNYTHVFYVDGSPVVTDAQIFTSTTITGASDDCKAGNTVAADIDSKGHVCGWGTVMVVPFRLGGGPISVDTVGLGSTGDGVDHGNCNHHGVNCDYDDYQSSKSAYVVLDITDPEQPPTVLGEITTGSYTTAAPAFSVHKNADGTLHFYLTVGSGPADNGGPGGKTVSAVAGSKLTVSVYDLATLAGGSATPATTLATGPDNSFAGDMVASDFDLNYSAEGVYFGAVTNPAAVTPPAKPAAYSGSLWKLDMNTGVAASPDKSNPATWTLKKIIDNGQPITIRPTVALDAVSRPMIYFGTGRSFTTDDDSGASNQGLQQQYIYGVSDNSLLLGFPAACQVMPTTASLFDASAVTLGSDATVGGLPSTGFTGVSTLGQLQTALLSTVGGTGTTASCYSYSGWRMKLKAGDSATATQQPSERVVSSQTLLGGILLTPTYVPPGKVAIDASGTSDCNPIPVPGTSNLYGLNYITGTADWSLRGSFGIVSSNVSKFVVLGSGKASAPVLHSQGGTVTAAFGLSGGTKLQSIGALSGSKTGEISWREPMDNQ